MKFFKLFGDGLPNTILVTGFIAVAGLCTGIILARTLSPFYRGEFAAVLLWPSAVVLFGDLGLGFAFSFYSSRRKDQMDGLWTLALSVSLFGGVFLALCGVLIIPEIVHLSEAGRACLIWNMITVPISLLAGYSAYFLLGLNYLFEFNMIRFSSTIIYTLGIVFVAMMANATVTNYTIVYILSQVISCILAVWWVSSRLQPTLRWQSDLVKPVFVYGGKTYLTSLTGQMNLRLDQLLMSSMISMAQLGSYVVAVSFSSLLMPLFNALAIVTLPRVSNAADLHAGGRQIVRYLQFGFGLGVPVMILGVVTAPWLLPYVFGAHYKSSVVLGQILLVGILFHGSNIILGNGLCGLGHPGKSAISQGVGLLVTIVFLVWLLPILGALGAAVTSLSAYALVTFIQIFYVSRIVNFRLRDCIYKGLPELLPEIISLRYYQQKLCSFMQRKR